VHPTTEARNTNTCGNCQYKPPILVLMIIVHLFYAGIDGLEWYLTAINNSPHTWPLLVLGKGRANQVGHDIQKYEASIRDVPNHTLHLWTLWSVYHAILGSWGRNGHESNHFCSSCQVTWGFAISFQNKSCSASSFDSLR
jgi:hypothetical protein